MQKRYLLSRYIRVKYCDSIGVKEVLFVKLFASVLIDEVFAGIQVAGENINAVATLL